MKKPNMTFTFFSKIAIWYRFAFLPVSQIRDSRRCYTKGGTCTEATLILIVRYRHCEISYSRLRKKKNRIFRF